MASKFTPGPWRYRGKSLSFSAGVYGPHNGGQDANWIADTEVGSEAEREANGCLMAASPDLLEALMNLENDDHSIPEHAWQMVQAAIQKAKGNHDQT